MGAGTGGTTARIIPMLDRLGVPYKYIMTDISSSLVAAARKRFKSNKRMDIKILNIKSEPNAKFLNSQHIVLATNCVHATRDLTMLAGNILKIRRPDGFLLLLEMTEQVPWVNFIFRLLEVWSLFKDDRTHALCPISYLDKVLHKVGFGSVEWTNGTRPEANLQRLIMAQKYSSLNSLNIGSSTLINTGRGQQINTYVREYTKNFTPKRASPKISDAKPVLVTSVTGSLGSYIVTYAAKTFNVIYVNCSSATNVLDRQIAAFERGSLHPDMSKIQLYDIDTSKPLLGLSTETYASLVSSVTHNIHNAWPMSLTRTVKAYEAQFKIMRNLINLAAEAGASFQFISSIGVVGQHSLLSGQQRVFEDRVQVESVLPVGYAEAKFVCERMLEETLHKHRMNATVVRIGQIAGSSINGYWNSVEHFASVIKSSLKLNAWPDLRGTLAWLTVNDVASSLLDLMTAPSPQAVYHIEGVRQSWSEMSKMLLSALGIDHVISYEDWVGRVKTRGGDFNENPAGQLMPFFEGDFNRMDCGGMILDTTKSRADLRTLRAVRLVDEGLVETYVGSWRKIGFLD